MLIYLFDSVTIFVSLGSSYHEFASASDGSMIIPCQATGVRADVAISQTLANEAQLTSGLGRMTASSGSWGFDAPRDTFMMI